ncbi:hypothetical protein K1T71_014290 [Dendrolimus kikuchii]|uniref:Uncharacterized protein n=1 Tax=Dendrolimus kikuchii TaxID=765133 RepID=A0ACC1CFY5_9NEOP|nr:hypothetical protein K1T71_014290 [Dendrolimus kikuchii]
MEAVLTRLILIFLFGTMVCTNEDIEVEVSSGIMLKLLRDMANQTNAADSLSLPANATSIRENITDTFSCENRTYGYYADVDNECQIFHICYPTQMASGRNVTMKWSFICPAETVFNQEVLVCTRSRDSIPCEDSPEYYDLNMEIGKVPNKTEERTELTEKVEKTIPNTVAKERFPQRKDHRFQNIVLENVISDIIKKEFDDRLIDFADGQEVVIGVSDEEKERELQEKEEERIALERRVRQGRTRGTLRFRADV